MVLASKLKVALLQQVCVCLYHAWFACGASARSHASAQWVTTRQSLVNVANELVNFITVIVNDL